MIDVTLVDAKGQPAPRRDGVWQLDEATSWVVQAPADAAVWAGMRPLVGTPEGFPFKLPFAVGHLALTVHHGGLATQVPLYVQPASSKLGPDLWATMLAELEAWLPGGSVGVHAPQSGSVDLDGAASARLAEAVLPLLPDFERALIAIVERPQTLARHPTEDVPLHRTRAADRETVAWLVRHPTDAAWLNPSLRPDLSGPPPEVPQRTVEDTLDHPANRHVAWLCNRVVAVLREAAAGLRLVKDNNLNDTAAWCAGRAAALDKAAARVERLHHSTFLRGLRPAPATEAGLLVVRDHPTYARAHRLARRILSPRFRHADGALKAPVRASFDLYELWAFFAVQRAIAGQAALAWKLKGQQSLFNGTGNGASFVGKGPGLEVRVLFNPTFGSVLRRGAAGPHSISTERRPDIVVTVQRGASGYWVALDAKYRAGTAALGDAFQSAHLYHDALRWPTMGGRCRGALLLCPRATPDAAAWFSPEFREEHGVGVMELAPGGDGAELGAWVLGR